MLIEQNPKAKGLIFDLDGTLIDTMPTHYVVWHKTLSKHGVDFTEDLFYGWAGVPTVKIVQLLNQMFDKNMDPEEIHYEKEHLFLQNLHLVKPIEPVAKIAKDAFGNIPISIGTGGWPDVVQKTLQAVNLDYLFDIIVTAKDVVNHKPKPDTFLKCAELMGLNPADCQVFEDGQPGVDAGYAAGMMVTDIRPYIASIR